MTDRPPGAPTPALALDGVSVRYPDGDGEAAPPAVDDVDLAVAPGTVLAVLGPSGSGKSTLLRAVAGLEPLAAGRIRADGRDLEGVPTHKRGFALMFQDGQLFGHRTVAQNVGYALRLRRRPRAEIAARVDELLDLVGLAGFGDRLPGTLSGGERQRVALARALAVRPRLLLLDEPLSALDASLRGRLAEDLRGILTAAGTTTLMVTHDQDEAFTVADRIAVMRAGRIVQEGTLTEVWQRPADPETALFLGYAHVLSGDAAARVGAAVGASYDGSSLALRRSALVALAADDPAATLAGTVISARATPERWRLTVEVGGLGTLDAVAPLGAHTPTPEPGQRVGLRVDRDRLAVVPSTGPAQG